MSSQFSQRRESRAAALQFLYAWSINKPANFTDDLRLFFDGDLRFLEQFS